MASQGLYFTDLALSQILKADFIVCYRYATHYKVAEDSISYRLLCSPSLSRCRCRIGSFPLFPASDFNLTHGCRKSTKYKRVFFDVGDRDTILAPVLACHHPRLAFSSFTFILTSIIIYSYLELSKTVPGLKKTLLYRKISPITWIYTNGQCSLHSVQYIVDSIYIIFSEYSIRTKVKKKDILL